MISFTQAFYGMDELFYMGLMNKFMKLMKLLMKTFMQTLTKKF